MRFVLGLALLTVFAVGATALVKGPIGAPLLAPSALLARTDGSVFRLETLTPMMHPAEYRVEFGRDALRRAAEQPLPAARKNVEAAIEALKGAVRLRPNDARAWAMLGVAQGLVGQRPEALGSLRRSARAAPEAPQIASTRLELASSLRSSLAERDIMQVELDLQTVESWNAQTFRALLQGSRYLRLINTRRGATPKS